MPLFLALAIAAVGAPSHPSGPNDAIVVEGRNPKDRAADYVDKVLPASFGGQFGRYEHPLCPKAIGVSGALAKDITDRIRRVATAADIEVAGETCDPNLIVIAAPDKKAMIGALQKSRPLYVKGVGVEALERLADADRPYMSWQITDVIGADGMPVPGLGDSKTTMDVVDGGAQTPGGGTDRYEGAFARATTTVSASRLRSVIKPRVLASVVIVETGALNDVSTRQLADFALVRAMIPTVDKDEQTPGSSILALFNAGLTPETAPQSVTWWDVAFLKSLTNTRSDHFANVQKNEIRHQMVKEMEKAPVEQR